MSLDSVKVMLSELCVCMKIREREIVRLVDWVAAMMGQDNQWPRPWHCGTPTITRICICVRHSRRSVLPGWRCYHKAVYSPGYAPDNGMGVSGGYVGAVGGATGGPDGATFAPDSPYFPFTSPSRRPLPHNAAGTKRKKDGLDGSEIDSGPPQQWR
ncbi:uncharacterized protein [Cherax quadricarinatus]|uniref:uncharacterized protein isoform X2 n=1 Tax=Cherax quadricarinatus TaxID=27406 RepID=UPI00387E3025